MLIEENTGERLEDPGTVRDLGMVRDFAKMTMASIDRSDCVLSKGSWKALGNNVKTTQKEKICDIYSSKC